MKKIFSVIISAIGFGIIAGAVMLAVSVFGRKVILTNPSLSSIMGSQVEQQVQQPTSETLPQVVRREVVSEDLSGVAKIASQVMPSVVSITNMQKFTQNGFSMFGFNVRPQEYEAPASGSGIVVKKTDEEIIIVTNNHVVSDSSSLTVTFYGTEEDNNQKKEDGKSANTIAAAIKGIDNSKDLAVISVKVADVDKKVLDNIKVARIGDSDSIVIGEQVVAIGNALGYGQSVTTGIISAKNRTLDDLGSGAQGLLQTDAAINPGNSGGALLNMEGELIGINVAKASGNAVEGMGYAIPIKDATEAINVLSLKKTRVELPIEKQGYLGVSIRNIDAQTAQSMDMPQGIYVFEISENGPAKNSDLRKKDIIVSFDDQNVKTASELSELVRYTEAGTEVGIKVKRLENGQYVDKEFKIKLGNRPKEEIDAAKESEKAKETTPAQNENGQGQGQGGQGQGGQGGQGGYYYDPFEDFDRFFEQFRGW